ncbi:MAG: TrkA family potassium uptake protein [Chloroflexota bacterium]
MAKRYGDEEFAVVGLGRFGSSVALTLEEQGHSVLGIDNNEHLVQHIADQLTQAVVLDSTNPEALRAVDIASFDTVIVAIGSDFENNLLTTVALKEAGVRNVICKAPTARQRDILLKVGADRVIQPENEAGRRLADELSSPTVLDKVALGPEHSVAEIVVPRSLAWKTLEQAAIRQDHGISILVIKRGDQIEVSPRATFILNPDDILVVLARNERIDTFCKLP